MTTRTVLVTGATGNQGGAVADALLKKRIAVRALVRAPSSPKAQALAARGAKLIEGDLDHQASVEAAAAGVDSVFVVTTPFLPGVGVESEMLQGRIVIDALKAAIVPHVVYSSISDADRKTGIPHFDSKADGERYLKESGLAATITAPVFFSENILFPGNVEDLKNGRFRQAMPKNRKLQVVSLSEIGEFNAAVIARGPELAGRRINYAGDEVTPGEMTKALAGAIGRKLNYVEQPIDELREMSEDLALMYEWFDRVGYSIDIEGLRREFPEVGWMSFKDWASVQNWPQILS